MCAKLNEIFFKTVFRINCSANCDGCVEIIGQRIWNGLGSDVHHAVSYKAVLLEKHLQQDGVFIVCQSMCDINVYEI